MSAQDDLAAEYARHSDTWGRWLVALQTFAAETDPQRAETIAAEVTQTMPHAFRARLHMVALMPLEVRRRELEAEQRAVYVADLERRGLEVVTSGATAPTTIRIERTEDPTTGGRP